MTDAALRSHPRAAEYARGTRIPVSRVVFYAGLSIFALVWFAPVFILIFTALKSASDFAHGGTFSLPRHIEWANFSKAWDVGIRIYFANSAMMTLVKVPTGVLIASLAAFALTFLRLPGERWIFTFFIVGLVVPIQMTLVPLTLLLRSVDLIDSLFGLFWIYLGFGLPFAILVMRGYMRSIPRELIDAAFIDGCTWFGVFWRIVLPLSKPAVVSLIIFDGIATWSEFILAQIFLRQNTNRTLPLGLVNFQTEFSTAYELLAAAQCITIVPLVLVYLFFQRYFVDGLSGSLKS
ncbi:carbohydrate ABC transporter permease [uncultured Alsobacter sp.]|uniref:carbohydrate ABC transporter permease n=1 Tax=uncultured Alsobacter sp. TaxID=1748258 RepID=UPI0025D6DCC4|nr:carbohydrate ABC transporter permease [uncultured Alsobacter sp.]